ncbi:hypothetical protein BU16DRAFT_580886 [Lophium mytilinum]|uniref:Uncharacterized protein n=1 Tax=Lophium mytilinum TaxID=390894 RepID=A0A6A6QWL6_9PEZI|nr:hypothetical protein BU16DRAFT_580886 [Lophium mytilinum]
MRVWRGLWPESGPSPILCIKYVSIPGIIVKAGERLNMMQHGGGTQTCVDQSGPDLVTDIHFLSNDLLRVPEIMEPDSPSADCTGMTEIIPELESPVPRLPLHKRPLVEDVTPEEFCYLLEQVRRRRRMKIDEGFTMAEDCTSWQVGQPLDSSSREEKIFENPHQLYVDAEEETRQLQNAGDVVEKSYSIWSKLSHELYKRISSLCFTNNDSNPQPDLKPSLLLRLPTELRLEIWRFVFSPPYSKPHRALSLLRTNHQIHEEAHPIAFHKIRFYFRNYDSLKAHLASLSSKQLTQLNHLRLPARSLEAALKDLTLIPLLADLSHTAVTITLQLPSGASNRFRSVPSTIALYDWRTRAEKVTGLRKITVDNNGFYDDWNLLLLFLNMHALDPRTPIPELMTAVYTQWAYTLRRRGKSEGGGFVMVMDRLDG